MKKPCVILGAGGHARVLIDSLRAAGQKIHGLLDPKATGTLDGIRILGGDDLLPKLVKKGVRLFAVGVGGVGDLSLRRKLFDAAIAQGLAPLSVVHPAAIVSSKSVAHPGSQILPGAIVNAGAEIGINTIINTGAIVEHDCSIGDHSHVATGAKLAGSVTVGKGAFIGAGAVIRQGITIGDGAMVAMGAVVISDVPSGQRVAGVPAVRMI